jgi:hypothetical protein
MGRPRIYPEPMTSTQRSRRRRERLRVPQPVKWRPQSPAEAATISKCQATKPPVPRLCAWIDIEAMIG